MVEKVFLGRTEKIWNTDSVSRRVRELEQQRFRRGLTNTMTNGGKKVYIATDSDRLSVLSAAEKLIVDEESQIRTRLQDYARPYELTISIDALYYTFSIKEEDESGRRTGYAKRQFPKVDLDVQVHPAQIIPDKLFKAIQEMKAELGVKVPPVPEPEEKAEAVKVTDKRSKPTGRKLMCPDHEAPMRPRTDDAGVLECPVIMCQRTARKKGYRRVGETVTPPPAVKTETELLQADLDNMQKFFGQQAAQVMGVPPQNVATQTVQIGFFANNNPPQIRYVNGHSFLVQRTPSGEEVYVDVTSVVVAAEVTDGSPLSINVFSNLQYTAIPAPREMVVTLRMHLH